VAEDIVTVIKCWVCDIMKDYSPRTASVYLSSLRQVFQSTQGLSKPKINHFIDNLNERVLEINDEEVELTELMMYRLMVSISNFYEYYPFDELEQYVSNFNRVRLPSTNPSYRTIPSSKDVYKFSFYLDKWYEETSHNSDNILELIHYFPVYLWWKLTSIIPIRPSEFANLSRYCLNLNNEKTYINLPRNKQKNRRKIQIPDTLFIPEDLFSILNHYIEITESFGKTHTLLSYRSISATSNSRGKNKLDKNRTNIYVLRRLVNEFYQNILENKYNLTIRPTGSEFSSEERDSPFDIQRKLRLHDSRHIAIVSLMLQGYDKVEIARLAGHVNLNDQYSYYNHVKFWVDSEVKRLSDDFGLRNIDQSNNFSIISPETNEKIEQLHLEVWTNTTKQMIYKLKLGYCSDKEMTCPSGFRPEFSGCYYCPHWGITKDELDKNTNIIKEEISLATDNLNQCTNFLIELHRNSEVENSGNIDTVQKSEIKASAQKVQSEIVNVARLLQLKNLLE
jgi:integrase